MDFPKSTRELLDKYWAAETTPEEEHSLRNVMQEDKEGIMGAYFSFLNAEASASMSTPVHRVVPARRIIIRRTMSIAAGVLLLVAAGFGIQRAFFNDVTHGTNHSAYTDSYDDPKEAYEEAKQALLFISAKLNNSREMAGEQIAKTQPYIEILK